MHDCGAGRVALLVVLVLLGALVVALLVLVVLSLLAEVVVLFCVALCNACSVLPIGS